MFKCFLLFYSSLYLVIPMEIKCILISNFSKHPRICPVLSIFSSLNQSLCVSLPEQHGLRMGKGGSPKENWGDCCQKERKRYWEGKNKKILKKKDARTIAEKVDLWEWRTSLSNFEILLFLLTLKKNVMIMIMITMTEMRMMRKIAPDS